MITENKKSNGLRMTEGSIWKSLLLFSIPLLIGNLFQQLYNTVDSIIVGNLVGKEALAAVGSSNSLINLIVGLFMGIATGAGVIISQYYGAKKKEHMHWAVHTSIALSIIGGAILIVLGIVLSPWILEMMGTPDSVMPNSVLYLRIFFCGSIFNVVYNMGAGILRAVGDSKRPLYYLCIASVVNIILDLLFVAIFHMEIAGVALATIIAQAVSAVLVLIALIKDQDIYQLHIKEIRIDSKMTGRILRMGIPTGLQSAIISLSNVIVQANINFFGENAMAGCSSYIKIDGFVILPIMSFGMAAMTFVGQNIGAGKLDRVKNCVKSGLLLSEIYTIVISILLFLTGNYILAIFTPDADVISCGVTMMRTLVPFYWMLTITQYLAGVFRGAGKATTTMLLLVGNMVGVRMIWVNIMTPIFPKLTTVLLGYGVSWITAMLCTLLYLWKGNWLSWDKKTPS